MPFELGIDYGVRKFARSFEGKKFLILSKTRFDYAKALSDLSGVDIRSHDEEPIKIIRAIRNWLTQYLTGDVTAPEIIGSQFNFMQRFYEKRKKEGFSREDVYEITSAHLGEFMGHMDEWIQQNREPIDRID